MSTFGITLDLHALRATLDATAEDFAAAARPAAQAGAQVLYDEVKRNVGRIKRKTGNLAASIYQAYSSNNSTPGGVQTYHVSWNASKAPHGGLVEFGHLQRYEIVRDDRGRMYPMVRPEMRGKPKPKRRASQAEKDAYYVPLAGGPRQIPAKPFIRSAIDRMPEAQKAMSARFIAELSARGVLK